MKKAIFVFLILLSGLLIAQNNNRSTIQNPRTQIKAIQPDLEPMGKSLTNLSGYDNIIWGEKYIDVKQRFITLATSGKVLNPIEIIHDIPEKEILIQRGDISYRYLFYKKAIKDKTFTLAEAKISRFFFAEARFNLIPSEKLYIKLSEKYGKHTKTTKNSKQRGAYIWNKEDGIIVQWLESYNDKAFTRSVYYISTRIHKEIMKDFQEFQFSKELKDLREVIP